MIRNKDCESVYSDFTFTKRLNINNRVRYITQAADFGLPDNNNTINISANNSFLIVGDVDITPYRLNFLGNCSIFGFSSETCSLSSTMESGSALISSAYTLPIQNITFGCNDGCKILNLTGDGTNGIDMQNVNFGSTTLSCGVIGHITNYSNVVLFNCATLDIQSGLTFDGSIGTIAINQTLFSGLSSGETYIHLPDTLTITRRFRTIFSSFVVPSGRTGINYDNITIPDENFILNNVNFSAGGTYLLGISETSNKSLFTDCIGIKNSGENGHVYFESNVSATTISNTSDYFVVVGTGILNSLTQKFTLFGSNGLTYTGAIVSDFLVSATLSLSSSPNNVCNISVFNNNTRETPITSVITTGSGGSFENVKLNGIISLTPDDEVNIRVRNTTGANNITIRDLSFLIHRI